MASCWLEVPSVELPSAHWILASISAFRMTHCWTTLMAWDLNAKIQTLSSKPACSYKNVPMHERLCHHLPTPGLPLGKQAVCRTAIHIMIRQTSGALR